MVGVGTWRAGGQAGAGGCAEVGARGTALEAGVAGDVVLGVEALGALAGGRTLKALCPLDASTAVGNKEKFG